MNVHRFGESKVNLDTLSRGEVVALNKYAHNHLGRALGEVAVLNQYMNQHGFYGVREAPEFGQPMTSFEHDPFIDGINTVRIEPS